MLFFSSDQHFGHANIIKYCERPFADVPEMNKALIDRWNDTVRHGDTVFVLGDWSMKKDLSLIGIAKQLHGHKLLMPGNHDQCFPVRSKHQEWRKIYMENGFEYVFDVFSLKFPIFGRTFNISHFPYTEDHTSDARYADYRPVDDGSWLICGHIHEKWKVKDRQINVGVDQWDFKPVSEDELVNIVIHAEEPGFMYVD